MLWLELEHSFAFYTSDAHSIFNLLSTIDWCLEVKIWAEDKQCSSCLLIQETKVTEILNILTSLYHVVCDTYTVHARDIKTRYSGWHWSCDQRRINILSNTIECNYSSRHTSSPLHFKSWKIENWRIVAWKTIFVSSTTPKISLKHDHNWTKGNDQLGFTASWKVRSTVFWRSNSRWIFQTNPIQTQSNLRSNGETCGHRTCFCGEKKKRPVHERLLESVCKEFGSSDRTGKPVKCEDNRIMHVHNRTGEPVKSSANTHIVEEFGSLEHRDTASSNANKFNFAIDEENIDFNISGVPNAMVKRSHDI